MVKTMTDLAGNTIYARICTDCFVPHVENCPMCFGFGFKPNGGGIMSAAEAEEIYSAPPDGNRHARYIGCPVCGGDIYGIQE